MYAHVLGERNGVRLIGLNCGSLESHKTLLPRMEKGRQPAYGEGTAARLWALVETIARIIFIIQTTQKVPSVRKSSTLE